MATMTGSKAKGGKKGRLNRISIEIKGNGFEVTKSYEPVPGKNGMFDYSPEKVQDSMVFNTPGDCLSFIEKCLGEREASAHEAAEAKDGY